MSDGASRPSPLARAVRGYYLATPLFAVADFALGWNVRVPFLDALPPLRWAYYAGGLALGLLAVARPAWTAAIGLAESTLDIALLVIGTMTAYYAHLGAVAAEPDAVVASPFDGAAVANLLLAAVVFGASWIARQHGVDRTFGPRLGA